MILLVQGCILAVARENARIVPHPAGRTEGGLRGKRLTVLQEGRAEGRGGGGGRRSAGGTGPLASRKNKQIKNTVKSVSSSGLNINLEWDLSRSKEDLAKMSGERKRIRAAEGAAGWSVGLRRDLLFQRGRGNEGSVIPRDWNRHSGGGHAGTEEGFFNQMLH